MQKIALKSLEIQIKMIKIYIKPLKIQQNSHKKLNFSLNSALAVDILLKMPILP